MLIYLLGPGIVWILLVLLGYGILKALRPWLDARNAARKLAIPCPSCGYSLRGNLSGICPECGKKTDM